MIDGVSPGPDPKKVDHQAEWDRSERRSHWIALAIALVPIPLALVISLALGSPPWQSDSTPPADAPSAQTSHAPKQPESGHR